MIRTRETTTPRQRHVMAVWLDHDCDADLAAHMLGMTPKAVRAVVRSVKRTIYLEVHRELAGRTSQALLEDLARPREPEEQP